MNITANHFIGVFEGLWLVSVNALGLVGDNFSTFSFFLAITTPPNVVLFVFLHQGVFCLLSVFTGSVQYVAGLIFAICLYSSEAACTDTLLPMVARRTKRVPMVIATARGRQIQMFWTKPAMMKFTKLIAATVMA